ncbi:VOC family protein [Arthrobacter bambusae]|uniref:VOC family protein n=1 Tax=Arthrobacter bambusae TaxID=1338426 RepID=UPI00278B07AB|nr:VOC family protein [Arthrobacter bambusae]MDQ0029073.1 catechol 2,3-dioxygenase-like lactoylglutathione lyase family enzyme [Arthrobacter bambusae]MDQ0098525.1 catechol 2,3-dioxygenase-like lactoylglutathione lyase family enzyme [Arthrobacter bambusae]
MNISAPKFEETIAFYNDMFDLVDFQPKFAKDYNQRGGTRFVGPQSSEMSETGEPPTIHISDSTPEYAKSVKELGINPRLNGHIAIAVDDIEEVKSRLTAAGVFFVEAGRWAVQDYHQIYTYDPSMNLIEINQAF